MRTTMKTSGADRGYTLVELAIVITILGIIIAAGVAAYTLYLKDSRYQATERALSMAQVSIAGFRSLHGHYPCPASPTAQPGDADYGYQDCTGSSLLSTNSVRTPALANPNIMIGTIPFRELNISERNAYDGYNNRLTYAVTQGLTDSVTYDNAIGGISLIDSAGMSVVDPADSGHFVVLSHGPNGDGAYTRDGVALPCTASTAETDNCNADHAFVVSGLLNDFDDEVAYELSMSMQEWQFSSADPDNIHLRRTNSVGVGGAVTADLSGDPTLFVTTVPPVTPPLPLPPDPGVEGIVQVLAGAAQTGALCDESGVNCFAPSVVAGDPTVPDGGYLCPSTQPYMYGIAGNSGLCTDELTFACPAGQYMGGIDAGGRLICTSSPMPSCPAATVTAYCGDTRTLPATTHGSSGFVYSGDCQMITPWSAADTAAVTAVAANFADVQAYINTRNSVARTTTDCGPSVTDGLVRERYDCSAGTWSASAVRRHRRTFLLPTPVPFVAATASTNAHQAASRAYVPATPMSVDPGNNTAHTAAMGHNCWCREDFRAQPVSCGPGYTGNAFYVLRYPCPKTNNSYPGDWEAVLGTVGSPVTAGCTCTPGSYTDTEDCHVHYGRPSSQVAGTMTTTTPYTCSGGVPVPGPATTTHNCTCQAQVPNPQVTTTPCPMGTSNSFTFGGVSYTNVNTISHNTWTCPTGMGGPVNSPADLGSWSGNTIVHTEACVCTPPAPMMETESCNATDPTKGGTRTYEREWDCATGTWEAPASRALVSDACFALTWQGIGTPQSRNQEPAYQNGDACSSIGDVQACYLTLGPMPGWSFMYDNCECK